MFLFIIQFGNHRTGGEKSASDIVGGFRVIQFAAVADANWKYAQREVWSAHSVYSTVCLLCLCVCARFPMGNA